MNKDTEKTSAKPEASEDNLKQAVSGEVEAKAETPEEKKEADRPGVCCGSCS